MVILVILDPAEASHVTAEHLWNQHTPIRLLKVFKNCHQRSSDRETGAVQRMNEVGLCIVLSTDWTILDAGSSGLK